MLIYYYHTVKVFLAWTEHSDTKRRLTKYPWLFQSIGGLRQLFCQFFTNKCFQKYEFYHRKVYQKSNAIPITAIMFSSYGNHYIPCFLIVPPCTGLRWCPNAVIIFLIYLSTHIFPLLSIQSKTNDSTNSGTSIPCCPPLRHYYMMPLLILLAFDAPSSDCLAKQHTHLLVKPTEWVTRVLQSIETIMYAWSVGASSQSTLFKPKTFSYHMVVLD